MSDVFSVEKRSEVMSRIRNKDTKPEITVRKWLFNKGYRYRKNDNKLPGKPDIVLPYYKTVIFINGCFWHNHKGCKYAYIPKTRTKFWSEKFKKNKAIDNENQKKLLKIGWKLIVIWECELKNKKESTLKNLINDINKNIK